MTLRLVTTCLALGTLNFAWAAGLMILGRVGLASPWIVWLVALQIFGGVALSLIAARHWRPASQSGKAAGITPTALASLHAPLSLPAPARDNVHRPADLLASDGR